MENNLPRDLLNWSGNLLPHYVREYIGRSSDRAETSKSKRLMEAHLAPNQPTQVNKITSSCEICRARLSKFEADFKQQQSEMTNKMTQC
ncbi:hypothetical protein Tco_0494929 [Tanacetum coccineum]